jgi:hypothetical protein
MIAVAAARIPDIARHWYNDDDFCPTPLFQKEINLLHIGFKNGSWCQLKVTKHVVPPILARFRRRHGQPILISAKVGTVRHCINDNCVARFQAQIFENFRNFFDVAWLGGPAAGGQINDYTVKKVDEVVRHPHLVTQDQFSLVSEKFSGIPEGNFTINIELFRQTFTNVELLRQNWIVSKVTSHFRYSTTAPRSLPYLRVH